MKTDLKQTWVSLAQVVDHLLHGSVLTRSGTSPQKSYFFEDDHTRYSDILDGLLNGEINSRGQLTRILYDYPILDEDDPMDQLKHLSMALRRGKASALFEYSLTESQPIPADQWWHEGAIWEHSILWVSDPLYFDDYFAFPPKRHRLVQTVPERPYDFEQITAFKNVEIENSSLRAYLDANPNLIAQEPKTKNSRNAGAKTNAKWPKIAAWTKEQLKSSIEWKNWQLFWDDAFAEVVGGKDEGTYENRHLAFKLHLKRNDPDLLAALCLKIMSTNTYVKPKS